MVGSEIRQMSNASPKRKTLPLGIDHLGALSSYLRTLMGVGTLANELIQNADDAKSKRIAFRFGPEGLVIENDGQFSDCQDQEAIQCPWEKRCDFHGFRDIASQGKRQFDDTTGAFGIGFTAVLQVTDAPELISAGRHWVIDHAANESDRVVICDGCELCTSPNMSGTRFILPWANKTSSIREKLGVPPLAQDDWSRMADELELHLPKTILFLRAVERIELARDGVERLVVAMPHDSKDLELTFGDTVQRWLLLDGDFQDKSRVLRKKFPGIEHKRESRISLAIPKDSAVNGLLYACLPTEHDTGLPFHIHGDFFPTTDRKRVVFGDDYQSVWNRHVLQCAASTLSNRLIEIRDSLGPEPLWQLINRIHSASCHGTRQSTEVGQCLWQELRTQLPTAPLVWVHAEHWARPEQVMAIPGIFAERNDVATTLKDIGVNTVHRCLAKMSPFLETDVVGVRKLNVGAFASALLEIGLDHTFQDTEATGALNVWTSRATLFEILDALLGDLPDRTASGTRWQIDHLRKVSLARCSDGKSRPFCEIFTAGQHTHRLFQSINTELPFLDDDELPSALTSLCRPFSISDALTAIENGPSSHDLGHETCCELIRWFKDRKANLSHSSDALERFRRLRIFPTATGYRTLHKAVLPGQFRDPLGITDVLDESLDLETKHFLEELGVKPLSLDEYIDAYLPQAFEAHSFSAEKCSRLVRMLGEELGRYRSNQELYEVLRELPFIATESGEMVSADEGIYFGTKPVRDTLGPEAVIVALAESDLATETLYEWLGVEKYPAIEHVVDRIKNIVSANLPDDTNVATIARLFEHLGERVDVGDDAKLTTELQPLKELEWLPCEQRTDRWFPPSKLSTVFRRYLFSTTGNFLAFSYDQQDKHRTILRLMGVTTQPKPEQVLSHLRRAAEQRIEINSSVYRWLEKRLANADLTANDVASLRNIPCLFVKHDNAFIYPKNCFLGDHPFGRRRCLLSGDFSDFPHLLEALRVTKVPDAEDAIAILHEIASEPENQGAALSRDDTSIISGCWRLIESSLERNDIREIVGSLTDSLVVCRADRTLATPREVFFNDCTDLARVFQGQLDRELIKRVQGTWQALALAGVREFSKCVEVKLVDVEQVGGDPHQLQQLVYERRSLLARVLDHFHGGTALKIDRLEHLSCYEIYSGILAYSFIGFGKTLLPVKEPFDAHYRETDTGPQILYREDDCGDMPWEDIARELSTVFEDLTDVAEIAAYFSTVLGKRHYEQAEKALDKLRIAALSVETIEKLEPATVSTIGTDDASNEVGNDADLEGEKSPTNSNKELTEDPNTTVIATGNAGKRDSSRRQRNKSEGGTSSQTRTSTGAGDSRDSPSQEGKRDSSSNERTQTRRAVTYVGHQLESDTQRTRDAESHRNSIDQFAIDAVLKAERDAGREASFQGALNQGYDIRSESNGSEEGSRLIEVKGLSGEWSTWGVKLSPSQHEAAKRFGERFWLYVVEFAGDSERQFIWRIQNPSEYVDEYRFDSGWKQLSCESQQNAQVPQVGDYVVREETGKKEEVLGIEQRGNICRLTLKVAGDEHTKVVFNRTTMRLIKNGEAP